MSMFYSLGQIPTTPFLELLNPFSDTKIREKIAEKWTNNTSSNQFKIAGLVVLAGLASIPGLFFFSPLIFRTIVIGGLETISSKEDIDKDSQLLSKFAMEHHLSMEDSNTRRMLTAIDTCRQMCEGIPGAWDAQTKKPVDGLFNVIAKKPYNPEHESPLPPLHDPIGRDAYKMLQQQIKATQTPAERVTHCFGYYKTWLTTHQDSKPWEVSQSWDNVKKKS